MTAASCSLVDPSADTGSDPVAGGSGADSTGTTLAEINPSTTAFVPTDDESEQETMADLESEWAIARARMLETLASAGYGIGEGNVLAGPGRFEFDLDSCPQAWDDLAGVEPDAVKISIVAAESGQYRSFGDIAIGMQLYFDYVNSIDGIDGRQIELEVLDDAYDAQLAADLVADVVAAEEQPIYVSTVGTPGTLAGYEDLNRACIPHPFAVSAHPAWGDPAGHPFTSGFQLSYTTEALLWGTWIKDNLPGIVPVKVGALVIDNEFGSIYADTFEAWAEENRDIVSEVVIVKHDPAALTVSPEIAELALESPDVFLSMTAGQPCLSAITEAARAGITTLAAGMFTPSGCRQPEAYLAPAGADGHGFWVVGGGVKSTNDPLYANDTFVRFTNDRLTAAGIDLERELVGVGFAQYGWAHVELLRVAASLPGGLTRSNVLLALRALDLEHPMMHDGSSFATEGTRDGYPVEAGEYSRYDSETETWLPQGAVDLNGASPSCSWVRLTCTS